MDPTITLAGKEYPIPLLAPKQQRIIGPALGRLRGMKVDAMTTEQFDDLLECVFLAVQRGTPDFSKVAFMDSPIGTRELFEAIPVIVQQTGYMKKTEAQDSQGEAQ
ncbi:hypothetical protein [Rhodopila sp.]|uniref:hypothetical protein n=1 Tax=Rhodopila sp. TaxID=2480087 RepID=UPI003D0A5051